MNHISGTLQVGAIYSSLVARTSKEAQGHTASPTALARLPPNHMDLIWTWVTWIRKRKTPLNINLFGGLPPVWVGGKDVFMCVLSGLFFMGREKAQIKSPENPGTIPGIFVYMSFLWWLFSLPIRTKM